MSYRAYDAVIDAGREGRTGLGFLAMCCVATLILGYMFTALLIEFVLGLNA